MIQELRALIMIVALIGNPFQGYSCSCDIKTFCDFLDSDSPVLAVKGEVVDTITYDENNSAVYFRVDWTYRDDYSISNDIIKIYGAT